MCIVDNLVRRQYDLQLGLDTLTPIASMQTLMVKAAGAVCLLYCNMSDMLDGGHSDTLLAQR